MFTPQKNRRIPVIMATQHPDNAGIPFWHDSAFISDHAETDEMYHNFSEIGCDEYMWDWEGKFADESIIEKLIGRYLDFFRKKQLGRDIFITLRIPNIWEEKTFKLARAYMSVLSAAEFTKSLKLASPPVFELILPMTKKANQLIHIQETFEKTARLNREIFGNEFGERTAQARTRGFPEVSVMKQGYIHIIPLFESVDDLTGCADLLESYIKLHVKHFGKKPAYLRPFIARSDPALNAGFVPCVLASRMALREFYRVGAAYKIPVYPIIGTGSLPFRGGVNPENIENILHQYEGVKTVTIQSAFRYDYPLPQVKKTIAYIKKHLANPQPLSFNDEEFFGLKKISKIFTEKYRPIIEQSANVINEMASFIPRRRERIQHIGLFGYNRGVGKTKLPRAISFTGAWYSLGIPPEFIATGHGLQEAKKQGLLPLLEKHFFTIRSELQHAGKYLNPENLDKLARKHKWAREIQEDVRLAAEILQIKIGPSKPNHFIHRNLTSTIAFKKELDQDFSRELLEAAVMRKSLG
jgi:phosphoenolpyruvate carboxylase